MWTYILKMKQKKRLLTFLSVGFLTLFSFQNCAPANISEGSSENSSSSTGASSNAQNNSSERGSIFSSPGSSGGAVAVGGGSGGSSSSGGSVNGGGVSVGSGSSPSNDPTLRFLKQPQALSIVEGGDLELSVQFAGGKGPYRFQWFLKGVAIKGGLGNFMSYHDLADTYRKEGNYNLELTDSTGRKIISNIAKVTIKEPAVGCAAGEYFTFTKADYDVGTHYFPEYFDGPRGKFLLHKSYDILNLFSMKKYAGLSSYVTPKLAYKAQTFVNCRTTIPRIHTPKASPAGFVLDRDNYKYQGGVQFECRNQKLLYKANTCKWVYDSSYSKSDR